MNPGCLFDLTTAFSQFAENLDAPVDADGLVLYVGLDELIKRVAVERQQVLRDVPALLHIQAGHELHDDLLSPLQIVVLLLEILGQHRMLAGFHKPERPIIQHDDELNWRRAVNRALLILLNKPAVSQSFAFLKVGFPGKIIGARPPKLRPLEHIEGRASASAILSLISEVSGPQFCAPLRPPRLRSKTPATLNKRDSMKIIG